MPNECDALDRESAEQSWAQQFSENVRRWAALMDSLPRDVQETVADLQRNRED